MTGARIVERPCADTGLAAHGEVPIAFEVASVFEVIGDDPATAKLVERPVAEPWVKDYDAIGGEGPTRWAKRWDLGNWALLVAEEDGERVGGAVVALDTPGVDLLEGRSDLAVLWDLRVRPDRRQQGIGSRLLAAAEDLARQRGCLDLKIETQDINVAGIRCYRRAGYLLDRIKRGAYDECPEETMLIWRKTLQPSTPDPDPDPDPDSRLPTPDP